MWTTQNHDSIGYEFGIRERYYSEPCEVSAEVFADGRWRVHALGWRIGEGKARGQKSARRAVEAVLHATQCCVQWQSATMAAPAFWYFEDLGEAHKAALKLRRDGCTVSLRAVVAEERRRA